MFGQALLPELKFEKWIKIAKLSKGWRVRGIKLGEKGGERDTENLDS